MKMVATTSQARPRGVARGRSARGGRAHVARVVARARPTGSSEEPTWHEKGPSASRRILKTAAGFVASAVVGLSLNGTAIMAEARLEGVNKPELLPKQYTPLIDVADFLTTGEEQRVVKTLERLERDTGVKLRVLCQNYPETPGLAIKDFWGVDSNTVVLVADPNTGNITNFNVGEDIDFQIPRNFWSKVAGKFGNKFYWSDQGPDRAIINSVNAIDACVREPEGRFKCTKLQSLEEEF